MKINGWKLDAWQFCWSRPFGWHMSDGADIIDGYALVDRWWIIGPLQTRWIICLEVTNA